MSRASKTEKDCAKDAKKSTGKSKPKGKRASVTARAGASRLLSLPESIVRPRINFILVVVVLSVFGLVMVYSSSSITAYNDFHNASYYFDRQAIFFAVSLVICAIVAAIPYRFWNSDVIGFLLWAFCCVTLGMTAFGFGVSELGAARSISIGGVFYFQPSEFAKIGVLIVVCGRINKMVEASDFSWKNIGIVALVVIVPVVLIYKQPDLGTALILIVGVLVMAILVGLPLKWLAAAVVVMVVYVAFSCITQPYHLTRIMVMIDPFADASGDGFQSIQSFYAFSSGGIFGQGLGLSRQKYLYLPYAHTDFVFSIIGEELGLVGAVATVLLFVAFGVFGFRIAHMAPDRFGNLLACGLTAMLCFQAMVNMASASGLGPVTGKALPFISYGGSSLLATFIIVGLILSVSFHSKLGEKYERRRDNLRVIDGKGASARPAARSTSRSAGPSAALGSVKGLATRFSGSVSGKGQTSRGSSGRPRGRSSRETSRRTSASSQAGSRHEAARRQNDGSRRSSGANDTTSHERLSTSSWSKRSYSSPAERAKARNKARNEDRKAKRDESLSYRGGSRSTQTGKGGRGSSSNRSSNRSTRRR